MAGDEREEVHVCARFKIRGFRSASMFCVVVPRASLVNHAEHQNEGQVLLYTPHTHYTTSTCTKKEKYRDAHGVVERFHRAAVAAVALQLRRSTPRHIAAVVLPQVLRGRASSVHDGRLSRVNLLHHRVVVTRRCSRCLHRCLGPFRNKKGEGCCCRVDEGPLSLPQERLLPTGCLSPQRSDRQPPSVWNSSPVGCG